MKKIITLISLMSILSLGNAQILYQSVFDPWTAGAPVDWLASSSTIAASNVTRNFFGSFGTNSYMAAMNNTSSVGVGMACLSLTVVPGAKYRLEIDVKSNMGDMAIGYYDVTNSAYGPISAYRSVTSTSSVNVVDSIIVPLTCSTMQFIVYAKNTASFGIGNLGVCLDRVIISFMSGPPIPPSSPYKLKSIYEIQHTTASSGDSPYEDSLVSTSGIVTAKHNNGYWIQDSAKAWNGIYVFDNVNTPSLGDEVLVAAEVDEFFNLTELKNVDTLITLSTGNTLPTPVAINTTDLSKEEKYEGVLCKVSSATCTNPSAGNGEWLILNTSDTAVVDDLIYAFTPILSSVYDVTGVVHYSFGDYKIEPRDSADIVRLSSVSLLENNEINLSVYPNPSNGFITISGINTGVAEVFSMDGKLVMTSNLVYTHTMDVSRLRNGVYVLQITSEGKTGTTRFVKQ